MTESLNRITLLPCPFCGNQPTMFDGREDRSPPWQVVCTNCQAEVWPSYTREQAIASWNTRHPTPAADALIEKLNRLLPNDDLAVYGYETGGGTYRGGVIDAIAIIRQHYGVKP